MNQTTWLDGFNLFHHWPATAPLFRRDSGVDIVRAVGMALGTLSRRLGGKGGSCVVYLDGGLSPHDARVAGLLVRYAGPGGKADDVMWADLLAGYGSGNAGGSGGRVTAVTDDRELAARLRAGGALCMGVKEFLAPLENRGAQARRGGKPGRGKADHAGKGGRPQATRFPGSAGDAAVLREKQRHLTPTEVQAWLAAFGGDEEA